jgi:hypothetical protein
MAMKHAKDSCQGDLNLYVLDAGGFGFYCTGCQMNWVGQLTPLKQAIGTGAMKGMFDSVDSGQEVLQSIGVDAGQIIESLQG